VCGVRSRSVEGRGDGGTGPDGATAGARRRGAGPRGGGCGDGGAALLHIRVRSAPPEHDVRASDEDGTGPADGDTRSAQDEQQGSEGPYANRPEVHVTPP